MRARRPWPTVIPPPRASPGPSRSASVMRCSKSLPTCQACGRPGGPRGDHRGDPHHQPENHRRHGRLVEGSGEERLEDAAGRRPVAEEGRQVRSCDHDQHAGARNSCRRRTRPLVTARGGGRHIARRPSLREHALPILAVNEVSKSLRCTEGNRQGLPVCYRRRGVGDHRPKRRGQDNPFQPDRRNRCRQFGIASNSQASM